MTIPPQNNNLNYLINPTFTNANRLFVLSFQRTSGENDTTKDYRDSFSRYYLPNIRIKDFNVLIDGISFFDLPVKNEEKAYEKIIDMSNNNDYTTDNLLDFGYFKENYKLHINLIGKLENQDHGATMFFIIEKLEETTFNFSQNSATII